MSYFMRYANERPDASIKQAVDAVVGFAKTKFKTSGYSEEWATEGFGITSIRPLHIQGGGTTWYNSNYWSICYAASETWTAWVSITQSDLAYEIITGLFNLNATPYTVEIYMTLAGKSLPTLNIEEMYAYDVSRLFWKKPVAISPEKPWDFYVKGIGGTGEERMGLMGYTVGQHAYLILRS